MEQEAAASIIVHVPGMHPELLPEHLPVGVRCFDPGLAPPATGFHTPGNLPLTPRQARQWVSDILAYGLQFQRPGDLAATAAASLSEAHILPDTMRKGESSDLQAFIASGAAPPVPEPVDSAGNRLLQAQMTLLLAWNLEERFLELGGLNRQLADSSRRFDQAIGPGAEEAPEEESLAVSPVTEGLEGPLYADASAGQQVLEPMLAFLERDVLLCSTDPALIQGWLESGIEAVAAAELPDSLAGIDGVRLLRAPGWRLCGHGQPRSDKPWLDAEFRVVLLDTPRNPDAR
jgi:hypothetical protein